MKFYLKSSKAFSLVEVMIAAGILGGISLGIMKFMELQSKGSKIAFQNQTVLQVMNEVNSYLVKQETCNQSLTETTLNIYDGPSADFAIYSSPGKIRYQAGSKIEQVEIAHIKARQSEGTVLGERTNFDIEIKFKRRGPQETYLTKRTKVIGNVSESGEIESCETFDLMAIKEMRSKICNEDIGGVINKEGKCGKDEENEASWGSQQLSFMEIVQINTSKTCAEIFETLNKHVGNPAGTKVKLINNNIYLSEEGNFMLDIQAGSCISLVNRPQRFFVKVPRNSSNQAISKFFNLTVIDL